MKKIIRYFLCTVVFSASLHGQQQTLSKGDKEFDNYNYVSAVKVYENLYNKGEKSPDILKKIGNSYYFQGEYEKAVRWYGELIGTGQSVESEYYYRYAQSLKSVKDYVKADQMMVEFEKRSKDEIRAKLASSHKDYLALIKRNSGRYEIENSTASSSFSDYGSFVHDNKLIFASSREKKVNESKNHKWNDQPFSDLYQADISEDGSLSNVSVFSKSLNSKYHESSGIITKDGKTIYFTRNNTKKGKKVTNSKKATLLKLYKATFDGKEWGNIVELPFNSDEYSVAHPALSSDERTLYFASDMPGTLGQSDIFKVEIKGENDYGTPVNLGKDINTEGKESFPFVSSENELYFSTDGHPGLGGLDIFHATSDGKGNFVKVQNIGEPANSTFDDFAFYIDSKTKNGYLSSNRSNGSGRDDIYKFKETIKISEVCQQEIKGVVLDDYANKTVANARVVLLDADYATLRETKTDTDGKYDLGFVDCSSKFTVRIEKDGYQVEEKEVFVSANSGVTTSDFNISPTHQKLKLGQDVGKILEINPIYFDFNKSFIREDAEIELNKILSLLEMYPTLEILIKSHTDSRASSYSNQILSEKRAKSTLEWFVSHGIKRNRLRAVGYGESQLINRCYDEQDCPEEEHQLNRRSEFIVTKI